MGIISAAPVVAAVSGGVSCILLVPRFLGRMRDISIRAAVRARMRSGSMRAGSPEKSRWVGPIAFARSALAVFLESGVPTLRHPADWLLDRSLVADEIDLIVLVLRSRGTQATPDGACQTLIALGITLALATLLFTGSLFLAGLFLALGIALVHVRASREQASLSIRSQELVPDAMRALGVYYGSGLTLIQSFEHAAAEVPEPLGSRMGEVALNMKAGMSAADALSSLRGGSDDMRAFMFLSIALEIQHRTGAPMQSLLENVAESVSASLRLKRSLEVQTAQARLSAKIVSIMPLLVIGFLAFVNPSYLLGFLSSPVGLAMFMSACFLELVGVLVIRKILAVDVG